jgi:Fe-S cluster assembly iron-binding protein IscA
VLTLTPNAASAIRALVDASELPDDAAGLRIADDPAQDAALTLSLAAVPAEDDKVVDDDSGARVFLAPQAAALLDDKTLDATTDGQGHLQFGITRPSA